MLPGRARRLPAGPATSATAPSARCSATPTCSASTRSCSRTCTPTTASTCRRTTCVRRYHPDGPTPARSRCSARPARRADGARPTTCRPRTGCTASSTFRDHVAGRPRSGRSGSRTARVNHPVEAYGTARGGRRHGLRIRGDTGESRRAGRARPRRRPVAVRGVVPRRRYADLPPNLHLTGREAGEHATRRRRRPAACSPTCVPWTPRERDARGGRRRRSTATGRCSPDARRARHSTSEPPVRVARMTRPDGRAADQLRPVTITRGWLDHAEGSVLVEFGRTRVLCTASVHRGRAALAQGLRPGLGHRRVRDAAARHQHPQRPRVACKGKVGGRTHEISRLIGRSACAPASTSRRSARTRSCSTATCCRPTAAPAPRRSPAPTWRSPTRSSWARGARAARASRPRADAPTRSPRSASASSTASRALDLRYDEDVARRDRHERRLHRRRATSSRCRAPREGEPFDRDAARRAARPRRSPAAPSCTAPCSSAAARASDRTARACSPPATRKKLAELRRILDDAGAARSSSSGSTTFDAVRRRSPETGLTFAENALLKARAVLRRHRPARGRRRLRAVRRRAQRDARRALARAGPGGTATTWPTSSWCWPRSPTSRTSAAAPRSSARPRWCCRTAARHVVHGEMRGRLAARAARHRRLRLRPDLRRRTASSRTNAELSPAEKDAISHRGNALRALAPVLRDLLPG